MKIKIDTWENLEKKFGLTIHSNINSNSWWTPQMEKMLPKNRIIKVTMNNDKYNWNINNFNFILDNDITISLDNNKIEIELKKMEMIL